MVSYPTNEVGAAKGQGNREMGKGVGRRGLDNADLDVDCANYPKHEEKNRKNADFLMERLTNIGQNDTIKRQLNDTKRQLNDIKRQLNDKRGDLENALKMGE